MSLSHALLTFRLVGISKYNLLQEIATGAAHPRNDIVAEIAVVGAALRRPQDGKPVPYRFAIALWLWMRLPRPNRARNDTVVEVAVLVDFCNVFSGAFSPVRSYLSNAKTSPSTLMGCHLSHREGVLITHTPYGGAGTASAVTERGL